MAQIKMLKGQQATITGGDVWAGLPAGTIIVFPMDGEMPVVASNEFNLVPISAQPPISVSPTSPVTVTVTGQAVK